MPIAPELLMPTYESTSSMAAFAAEGSAGGSKAIAGPKSVVSASDHTGAEAKKRLGQDKTLIHFIAGKKSQAASCHPRSVWRGLRGLGWPLTKSASK